MRARNCASTSRPKWRGLRRRSGFALKGAHPSRRSNSSTALSSTCAPAARSSGGSGFGFVVGDAAGAGHEDHRGRGDARHVGRRRGRRRRSCRGVAKPAARSASGARSRSVRAKISPARQKTRCAFQRQVRLKPASAPRSSTARSSASMASSVVLVWMAEVDAEQPVAGHDVAACRQAAR